MARLLGLVALLASAVSVVNASSWSGGSSGSSWPSGSSGSSSTSSWSAPSPGSVDVGIIIIVTNAGGSSPDQQWNSPMKMTGTTHQVVVGGTAGDVYTPNSITANVGDMVEFTFMETNHTATQSSFTTPCIKLDGGVDSGFMSNPNNTVNPPPTMKFQVTTTDPIWMYCRQTGHCGTGMTFSINPTSTKTQAAFMAAAIKQNGTSSATSWGSGTSGSAGWGSGTSGSSSAAAPGATVVAGTGVDGTGAACSCECLCGTNAFPPGSGIGAFGGIGGQISVVQSSRKRDALDA